MTSGQSPYTISIRDKNLIEQESGDGYMRLRLERLNNDLCAFSYEVDSRHSCVDQLLQPGAGIVVRPQGSAEVELSGPVMDIYFSESDYAPKGDITAVGVCDNILMAKELAFINTGTDVSTSGLTTYTTEFGTYTGAAETVMKNIVGNNIGPAAGIVRRRYPFLNIPASTGLGLSSTWKTRFEPILDKLQEIGTGSGLSFRTVQAGPGQLDFQVWTPSVVPEARFSLEAHNIRSYIMTLRAPDTMEVIVGGGGEGRARVWTRRVASGSLQTLYGRRATTFHSRMDTVTLSEMRQTADEDLAEGIATAGVEIDVIDTPSLQYGVHYKVGDIATAVVRGTEISDTIQRVVVEHVPGSAPKVTPSIGIPLQTETDQYINQVKRILRNLGVDSRR